MTRKKNSSYRGVSIFVWILSGFGALCGCSSLSNESGKSEAELQLELAEGMGDLADQEFGPFERIMDFPDLEARTKVGSSRVESPPLQQTDGRQLSGSEGRGIGFPASIEIRNADSVPVEITKFDVRRRTPSVFGYFASFLGDDPIRLKPGEVWDGTFIVSRREGWYRLEAEVSAPEGWTAVRGDGTRGVYFREETLPKFGFTGYAVTLTFWNLNEEPVEFRYWVADEDYKGGIPSDPLARGNIKLKSEEALQIEFESDSREWNLVTASPEDKD
ncbi:MAG: hypothetical protein AAGJ81_12765 [Verrucomicrobiota bacterium]